MPQNSFHFFFLSDIKDTALPFPNLRCLYLRIDHLSLNDKILSRFHELFPKLEEFGYSEYDFFNKPYRHDQWLLEELSGRKASGEGIKRLAKCPKLKSLHFYHLSWLTGDSLVHLAANTNGRIESLGVLDNQTISDAEMIAYVLYIFFFILWFYLTDS